MASNYDPDPSSLTEGRLSLGFAAGIYDTTGLLVHLHTMAHARVCPGTLGFRIVFTRGRPMTTPPRPPLTKQKENKLNGGAHPGPPNLGGPTCFRVASPWYAQTYPRMSGPMCHPNGRYPAMSGSMHRVCGPRPDKSKKCCSCGVACFSSPRRAA
jgi:hypothetical protein